MLARQKRWSIEKATMRILDIFWYKNEVIANILQTLNKIFQIKWLSRRIAPMWAMLIVHVWTWVTLVTGHLALEWTPYTPNYFVYHLSVTVEIKTNISVEQKNIFMIWTVVLNLWPGTSSLDIITVINEHWMRFGV